MNMNPTLPAIGVVVIGVNVQKYLADCIRSVRAADYPQELITVTYVDGGSMDGSKEIADQIPGITVIALNDVHPTPGRGRNAGWRATQTPLIQFLDADTTVDPRWFRRAVVAMKEHVVAVCGHRQEKYPHKNIFHRITQMEWGYELGPCRYFGGDVLIRRSVLEATGGFDEKLVAGEDPELSYRIRYQGGLIIRIDADMTTHDINMNTWRQYWRRAFRSGYAYAEIGLRFARYKEKLWFREFIRISASALLPPLVIIIGSAMGQMLVSVLIAALIIARPFMRLHHIKSGFQITQTDGYLYAGHAALVVYPQFCGVVRYLMGRLRHQPLRNKGRIAQGGNCQ